MQNGERARILIVEDEWILAGALAANLADMGYDVVGPAANVPTALALLEREAVSAAVLDVSLGFAQKSFPIALVLAERGIPFLFITGYQISDLPCEFSGEIVIGKPVMLGLLERHLTGLLSKGASV